MAMLMAFGGASAIAQSTSGNATSQASDTNPPAQQGLWERSNLFGDMGGLRPWLGKYGVTFGLQETSEYLNNLSGGTARGGTYDGMTEISLGVETQKAFGIAGGIFNVSALQIHGTSISTRNLQTLQFASGVEAQATTRLWELWYQQSLADGRVDIKIGQQSLDQEFMTSDYASLFMNATFGWSALPSVDLPAGGPAYPLASPGVRVRGALTDTVTVLAGVFGGNPAGSGEGDPQQLNAHGTNFSLEGGALLIGEVQYALNPPSENARSASASGTQSFDLPGTYKLGFWYDTQQFADQRVSSNGVSLASPASSGVPQNHHGNWSVYAVADQMVWRPAADSAQSVNVFARIMGAPGDRNLVDLGVNAGVTLKAPFKGRDNDAAGLAVGYAKIGSHARDLASDTAALSTPGYPSRSAETVIEATYQYQLAPWWQLQGDMQYFIRPGGGIPNPGNSPARIGNEFVVGVRTSIVF